MMMENTNSSIANFMGNKTLTISIEQFHEICRTCLAQGAQNSIFETDYNDKSLSDILNLCTPLEVQKEDYLPKNVCSCCFQEIIQLYAFFQKCRESEAALHYIIDLDLKSDQCDENSTEGDEVVDSSEPLHSIDIDMHNDIPEDSIKPGPSTKLIRTRKSSSRISGPPFTCKRCGESFEEFMLLKKHYKVAGHLEAHATCPLCSKSFNKSKLPQHMRIHTKEKPYRCKTCFRGFSIAGNLKRHMMTHTGERPHTCEFCGKGFIQATSLHKHKRTHSAIDENIDETGVKHFHCGYCGRAFKRQARYNAHVRRHDSKTGEITKMVNDTEDAAYEYICVICSRACKTKHLLKAHERTHGEKSFLCNECGKSFTTNAALQSHLRTHTGEKPYSCNICKKAFSHIGTFEAHMLIHTGQKPYQCTVCSKSFTQLTHLKYHKRTHSGERPYVCNYCGKSFALNGNLTVHTRTHTGETPYLCSVCGKGFYDSSSMKKHKRGHVDKLPLDRTQIEEPLLKPPLLPPDPPVPIPNNVDVDHLGYIIYQYPD